ncbi:MAG: hypothetical protein WCG42_01535 [Parachlamydiaceae bacterium]
MITIKNVKTSAGTIVNHTIDNSNSQVIDGERRLLMIPTMIDIDAIMKTDLNENITNRYIAAGITTIFDAEARSAEEMLKRQEQTTKQPSPLRVHYFYKGNNPNEFSLIGKIKQSVAGIKISFDLAEKPIAAPHTSALDRIFQIAAQENMIVVIALLQGKGDTKEQRKTASTHVEHAIKLAEKYSTELCLQHVRTKEELALIKEAKQRGQLVYTEVAYPHLFITEKDFPNGMILNGPVLFLPNDDDQNALWEGIRSGAVDMIGSSGILLSPPELLLPLLLQAHEEKKISLDKIIEITRVNQEAIFRLPQNHDVVLIDPAGNQTIPEELLAHNSAFSQWKDKIFSWKIAHVVTGN